jgi:RNA polymerase sigma-70 factor (ECF subfamily)
VSLESLTGPEPRALIECDSVADTLEGSECHLRLRKALKNLPAVYRRVLADHFVRGQSTKQIARREGIPLGTVLSRIFTAKRILRQAFENSQSQKAP